jgi:hypothetical protein
MPSRRNLRGRGVQVLYSPGSGRVRNQTVGVRPGQPAVYRKCCRTTARFTSASARRRWAGERQGGESGHVRTAEGFRTVCPDSRPLLCPVKTTCLSRPPWRRSLPTRLWNGPVWQAAPDVATLALATTVTVGFLRADRGKPAVYTGNSFDKGCSLFTIKG